MTDPRIVNATNENPEPRSEGKLPPIGWKSGLEAGAARGAKDERERIEREFQRRHHAVTDPAVRAELEAFIDWLRGEA